MNRSDNPRVLILAGICFAAILAVGGCSPEPIEPWLEDWAEKSCNPDGRNYEECVRSQRELDSRVRNTPPIYPEGR